MANALTDVQNTFLSFDAQYSVLLAGCTSQPQREALIAQYAAAQLNYQKALDATLEDNDA